MAQFRNLDFTTRLCVLFALFIGLSAHAQTLEQSAQYISQIDSSLTIRKISVLPASDNLDGIYARPLENQLISYVKGSHRWDYVESNLIGSTPTASDLEESPAEVQKLTSSIDADAFLIAQVSKGPNGISIRLDLFLKNDGQLLAQEILKDHPRFELNNLKDETDQLLSRLIRKVPYDGLVMSRQNNRVTLNIGKSDGITKDQIVTVIQIIKATRHPKFNFLISTEKEVLGKVKILKVDDSLSFGAIISEKEKGAILRLSKISGLDVVNYPEPDELTSAGGVDNPSRPENDLNFGKNPKEWVPIRPPSFGLVALKLGLGTYASSVSLPAQKLEAKSSIYPSIYLGGELWLNPEWTVRADIAQGVISTPNPLAGSAPSQINQSMSRYSLTVGYNFLLQEDFWGPKLQVNTGATSYRMYADDSSPTALTTVEYFGFLLGLKGSLPVDSKKIWTLGAIFNLVLFPRMQERPVDSGGSPKNTINDFSLFCERKLSENMLLLGSLDFSLYSTNFSGSGSRTNGPATSLSQRHMNITGGIAYMF